MTVYISDHYGLKLPDGSNANVMSADSEDELHTMAEKLGVSKDRFSAESSVPFYLISTAKSKMACRVYGAFKGEEARETMRNTKMILNLRKELENEKS